MPGHLPTLNPHALERLRDLVHRMHERNGRALPLAELIELTECAGLGAGITIDFAATALLGHPMVVLRVPEDERAAMVLSGLSKRERQVAVLIARGLSNKEIAYELGISVLTVKDHVHNLLAKTGLRGRVDLAALLGSKHRS